MKVDELFGGARLVAETPEGERHLIYYTKAYVPEFAALSHVINELAKGKEPPSPEQAEPAYCRRCGAPLLERGANCTACVQCLRVFYRLLGLLKPYRGKVTLMICSTLLMVAAQMGPPYLTKMIVDEVIKGHDFTRLNLWIGAMVGCGLVLLLTGIVSGALMSWLGARLVTDLRSRLHAALQRLQMSYYQRRESGEIVSRVMNDTGELQHFLIDGLPYFLVNGVSFVVIACILLRLDVWLALLVFLPVPFLICGSGLFWRKLVPLFHKHGNQTGALHSILNESIYGIKIVKAFAQERSRVEKFDSTNAKLFRTRFSIERTFIGFAEGMSWVMSLGIIAVWYFAAKRIAGGDPNLTLGDLLAFVGYIWLFFGPLRWFTAVVNWMTHAFAGAERVFAVLDAQPEVYDAPDAASLPKLKGAISFKDVRFSYERGKEVIKGISFDIAPGEMIGLVGKSGAGKSTIINLVCRFHDVDSGLITVDGHPLKTLKLEQFRRQLGIVPQDPFLFNASVLENIRYGRPEASFEDVVRAARAANAHDFILDKEEGYDSIIGEKGTMLSGGEKQRIAIARAILHDPPILILDEATSSVDTETEKGIQEAIAYLIKGRTTIAIAHRLSTLRNAHRLVVVDDGLIIEQGTHDELVAKDGHYAKLVKMQTELNRLAAETAVWKA
ncbi:MAG: ABC transporter ATP-binding protein [Planctomycetota bacterium]|nr:ABC transporter ATP-binding protein [Planctomycetota bacterium]